MSASTTAATATAVTTIITTITTILPLVIRSVSVLVVAADAGAVFVN